MKIKAAQPEKPVSHKKNCYVSFRLSEPESLALLARQAQCAVKGAYSDNQYARKILIDFLAGRLVYKNRECPGLCSPAGNTGEASEGYEKSQ